MDNKTLSKVMFCLRYLRENGIDTPEMFSAYLSSVDNYDTEYALIEVKKDFFTELADALRSLWPPGEKDGKYPWRDSSSNISARLQTLWAQRNLKDYTKEQCLRVARKYLAQFEDNAKYMKTLKYWIFRQEKIVEKDGKVRYIYNSTFADMLESDDNLMIQDWSDEMFETSNTIEQGQLI